jgi:hypothetical protein
LLYLSLELTILKQFVILQQNSICLQFEDLWILLPCIVLIVVEQQCCKWEGKDRGKQTDQEQKKANDHSQIDY